MGGGPSPSGGPSPTGGGGGAPLWAQSLARRQRLTQAGLIAAGALREGDRGAISPGPDLKNKS
jgi:type IV secretion system protein TrbL